jgi:hypothetical protein
MAVSTEQRVSIGSPAAFGKQEGSRRNLWSKLSMEDRPSLANKATAYSLPGDQGPFARKRGKA